MTRIKRGRKRQSDVAIDMRLRITSKFAIKIHRARQGTWITTRGSHSFHLDYERIFGPPETVQRSAIPGSSRLKYVDKTLSLPTVATLSRRTHQRSFGMNILLRVSSVTSSHQNRINWVTANVIIIDNDGALGFAVVCRPIFFIIFLFFPLYRDFGFMRQNSIHKGCLLPRVREKKKLTPPLGFRSRWFFKHFSCASA